MKRIISGIQPSGNATIGNYFGAMKRWANDQAGNESLFFIPNLHALTSRTEPAKIKSMTYEAVAWILASGVDPDLSSIFVQSQVHEHSELSWILNNYTTMGELSRMTQYKDKAVKQGADGRNVGLFDYPVLMAADILLYQADDVPVGEDQRQHVELTRDIAERFNNLYGNTFKVPTVNIAENGGRIMNLQDPNRKMSKSDTETAGAIYLMDTPAQIQQKIKRAVTDSGSVVQTGDDKPAISNLLVLMSLATGRTLNKIEEEYITKGYGDLKTDLADAIVSVLEPVQSKYHNYIDDLEYLNTVIARGRTTSSSIARTTLSDVKSKLGLL
jgi:tryptophanyl-tRNA synthetase